MLIALANVNSIFWNFMNWKIDYIFVSLQKYLISDDICFSSSQDYTFILVTNISKQHRIKRRPIHSKNKEQSHKCYSSFWIPWLCWKVKKNVLMKKSLCMLSCTKLIFRVKCEEHKVNSRDRRKASDYIPLAFIYTAYQKKKWMDIAKEHI